MSGSAPHVLVLNTGSSSLKYSLVDAWTGQAVGHGMVDRIGEGGGTARHVGPAGTTTVETSVASHEEALRLVAAAFQEHGPDLARIDVVAVGHRVVHGGTRFSAPVVIDDELIAEVTELIPLAPLHNPANLEGIRSARVIYPDIPHVAVFDTAFHQTLPPAAYTYAVPRSWREEHDVRRYGFHGTSVAFVSRQAAALLGRAYDDCRVIVLHLGNGASATAVRDGRSADTSMGLTPLEGLVMGTRSGDVDPALPAYLGRLGFTLDDVDQALNRESGLRGLAGQNDFRELDRLRAAGDPDAVLAFDVYCHRLRKYVGAYAAVLGRVDAVVFTGGVGENSPDVRAATLADLDVLGVEVDGALNAERSAEPRDVATERSRTRVLVVPTNEEWEIAQQAVGVVEGR